MNEVEDLDVPFPSNLKVEITFRLMEVLVDSLMGVSLRLDGHCTWERREKVEHFGLYSFRKMRYREEFSDC